VSGEFLRAAKEGAADPDPIQFAALVAAVASKEINGTTAKALFAEMITTLLNIREVIASRGLGQISDTGALESIIADVIAAKSVNIPKAEMYVNADPVRQKLKDNWIASKAKVLEADPVYANLPDDQKKLEAQKAATKEFYDEAGRAYQNTKYGVAYDEAGTAAGGGSKNAYSKYATGMENRRLPNNSRVSVYGVVQPNGKPILIRLPPNYRYLNTTTNKEEDSAGSGASLSSPAVGWAAKNIKTGEYIDPSEYKNTRASEVKFVPGVYGIKSNLQTRTGAPSMVSYGGSSLGGPGIVTDQIFIEEGVPGWKVLASDIFKAKGSSYEAAKAKALKETKSKFLQGTPKKKKFRTSK
jgi:hypothetical protein